MATSDRGLLSIGVFLIIVVVSILLYVPLGIIADPVLILPLIILLSGLWTIVLAGIRSSSPQKYERGAFDTLSWGLLLVTIGGAWFVYGFSWYYSLIIILLALGALAIAAAIRRK